MTKALLTLVILSNFQLRYDPAVLHRHTVKHLPKLTSQQNGTDIPVDVGPERDQVLFPDNGRDGPDQITFIPLRDTTVPSFDKAYPEVAASAKALRGILSQPGARPAAARLQAADVACIDNGHAFHARLKPLKFAWGSGIAFVTQYSQEEESNPPNNGELALVFLGLTANGSHYVRAEFAIRHPALPPNIRAAGRHVPAPAQIVEKLAPERFTPSLAALEEVLGSISPR